MSRLGNKPIVIPQGVTIKVTEDNTVLVKGSKGEISKKFKPIIKMKLEGNELKLTRGNDLKATKALHGTTRMLIVNMLKGVTEGFEKELEAIGVGYRFAAQGNNLQLAMGYSHPIEYASPAGIKINVEGQTIVKISGIDKEKVGKVASEIRSFRGPEPYKGKGIKYKGEHIIRKAGKAGKAGGSAAA
ncbi:MAG: 50S ribosomal protein L6 [Candidatus Margulisbacteria bacterium]|nr:50S ribosomal protein L6 [Candidatus Margulisiibacteriota bacterium]